jgi:hypothetical protein
MSCPVLIGVLTSRAEEAQPRKNDRTRDDEGNPGIHDAE